MLKHMLAITMAVATVSLLTPGVGSAGVACTPHCEPADRVVNRANEAAGPHGQDGRDKAVAKQKAHRDGSVASPLVAPVPPPSPTVPPPGDTGGDTAGVGNPCTGC